MKKYLLGVLSASVVSLLALSYPAKADPISDPEFTESLPAISTHTTCSANCASEVLGLDPLSGMTTLEYIFNSTIETLIAGDVEVKEFGESTIGDVIRFENISTVGAVAFIFSNDTGGGLAADVGLPSTFQSNTLTLSENDLGMVPAFTPTSTQPGHCVTGSACANGVGYGLISPDIPEPASLAVFGTALVGLGFFGRRRRKAQG